MIVTETEVSIGDCCFHLSVPLPLIRVQYADFL